MGALCVYLTHLNVLRGEVNSQWEQYSLDQIF